MNSSRATGEALKVAKHDRLNVRCRNGVMSTSFAALVITAVVIAREGGRSNIPETSSSCREASGILDAPPARGMTSACGNIGAPESAHYFSFAGGLIGGAIFSAGAGGSAGFAPSFWACGSGRAGSGAGVVGRVPPGFDSAGLPVPCGAGVPWSGGVPGVTCASAVCCGGRAISVARETPAITAPAAISAAASTMSRPIPRFSSSVGIASDLQVSPVKPTNDMAQRSRP